MLESDAEQRRQSDACFHCILQFFKEQAHREAEDNMAVQAEVAEVKQTNAALLESLLWLMDTLAARREATPQ